MTEHFCDTCNRVRLSSSGALHTCLAHDDAVDLRAVLQQRGPRRRCRPPSAQPWREARRPHLPAGRPRRPAQGDDPDRRLSCNVSCRACDPSPSCAPRSTACAAASRSSWPRWWRSPRSAWSPNGGRDMGRCADLAVGVPARHRRRGPRGSTPAARRWCIGRLPGDPAGPPSPSTTTWTCSRPTPPSGTARPFKFTREDDRRTALVRPRHHRRQGPGADRPVRRPAGARATACRSTCSSCGSWRRRSAAPTSRQGLQAARRPRASRTDVGGGVRHHLAVGGAAGAALRPARADGLHRAPRAPGPRTCTRAPPAAPPATRSASWPQLIAECYDARTGRVKIPGFYDDVRKLTAGGAGGPARGRASRASASRPRTS